MSPTGYQVRYPSGTIAGNVGTWSNVFIPGYEAMDKEAARDYITKEAERLGLNPEDFELLRFEADFVEGVDAPRRTRIGPEGE